MIIRAYALHGNVVVYLAIGAGGALVSGGVVVLVVGADGAVLAVEVGVYGRAVLALVTEDVVDLLEGAVFAFQVTEIPVLGMLALDALL